jgi:hypothetical protein
MNARVSEVVALAADDAEVEALRAQVEALTDAAAVDRARIAELEVFDRERVLLGDELRALHGRFFPTPPTDVETLVAEFVAKLPVKR